MSPERPAQQTAGPRPDTTSTSPVTAPVTAPEATVRRRRLGRGVLAGIAALAVGPVLPLESAEAAGAAARRRHRRHCRHWHRCQRHPRHTCRRLHRCKHRRHRAPVRTPAAPAAVPAPVPPAGPSSPPEAPLPPVDPEFVAATLPTAQSLHLLHRFSYGFTPALHQEIVRAGSPQRWFEEQLAPAAIADPAADEVDGWWTSLSLDAAALVRRERDRVENGWDVMCNYGRWCLLRRIRSERQVLEVMTEFWENHLHVPITEDGVWTYRADYGRTIRRHALGRFAEMLVATTAHPAMGISLDNATSTKRAPNENLGRELLELHTVGRGRYTEADVKAAARILTGYRVDVYDTWRAWYDPASHATGPVSVLGFSHANAAPDGRAVAAAFLRHLARHPDTGRTLARKLAVRFVSDTPSEGLVEELAAVYLRHGTAIKPVLRALVAHPEFAAAAGAKVRTPTDDVVATHRALRTRITRPTGPASAANGVLWQAGNIGQMPFAWGRPDGQPEDNASWSSPSRLLASFDAHYGMAGRWWPREGIDYRAPAEWLPAPSLRFEELVDHLCRELLGRVASARLLSACTQATGVRAGETVTADHAVIRSAFPTLLTTLLDTPEHLHR